MSDEMECRFMREATQVLTCRDPESEALVTWYVCTPKSFPEIAG
jgi:hypothetical protein